MPIEIPLVRVGQVLPFVSILEHAGAPVARMLSGSGLPSMAMHEPDVYASAYPIYDFVDRAARAEGIEDLGWRAGIATRASELGGLGESFLPTSTCVTVHEALRWSFAHAQSESRQIHLWLERCRGGGRVCYVPSLGVGHDGFQFAEQYMLALLTALIRTAAGDGWRPAAIEMRSPSPTGLENVEELTDVPLRTRATRTALYIEGDVLRLPLSGADAGCIGPCFDPLARSSPRAVANDDHFVESLRLALAPYLPDGVPGIATAAKLSSTSVRTLQRLLDRAGTNYSRVVDELRLMVAKRHLLEGDEPLAEIARQVGYADPAHFTRAFRRWTGERPSSFRARGRT